MNIKRFLFIGGAILSLSAGIFFAACANANTGDTPEDFVTPPPPVADGPTTYSVVANGENGVASSTKLTFTFSKRVSHLEFEYIDIHSGDGNDGDGVVQKNTDWRTALLPVDDECIQWELAITTIEPGEITLQIRRRGIENAIKTVTVFSDNAMAAIPYTALANGTDTTENSTRITLTFNAPVDPDLTEDIIFIDNGTGEAAIAAGSLAGSGTTWTFGITVTAPGGINVRITRPSTAAVAGIVAGARDVIVYKAGTAALILTYTATANGEANGTMSSAINFTFSGAVPGSLTAANIHISLPVDGSSDAIVTKGVLTGSGTSWSLPVTITLPGNVIVRITYGGIEAGEKTVTLFGGLVAWELPGDAGLYRYDYSTGDIVPEPLDPFDYSTALAWIAEHALHNAAYLILLPEETTNVAAGTYFNAIAVNEKNGVYISFAGLGDTGHTLQLTGNSYIWHVYQHPITLAMEEGIHLKGRGLETMNGSSLVILTGANTKLPRFIMNGGSISGNKKSSTGGGVDLSGGGTFIMNGGEIYNNRTTSGNGGGVALAGLNANQPATFTMNGGTIRDNFAREGGGVHISGYIYFTMTGSAAISSNAASGSDDLMGISGGGVYFSSSSFMYGIFTMDGGIISNNTLENTHGSGKIQGAGVAVVVNALSVTIKNAQITNNTGTAKNCEGGGLHIAKGVFRLEGTSDISGNEITSTAAGGSAYGGGIFFKSSLAGTHTIKDSVVISGNTATAAGSAFGGGIHFASITLNVSYTITDSVVISGNTAQAAGAAQGGGVYLGGSKPLTMSGGTISGNKATSDTAKGGGLYIKTTSTTPSSMPKFYKTGGTIYGKDTEDTDNLVMAADGETLIEGSGHAIYIPAFTHATVPYAAQALDATVAPVTQIDTGAYSLWQ